MPQLASVSGGQSESKMACETGVRCGACTSAVARVDDDADVPAESVLLRVRDRVGFVELLYGESSLQRDGSTKGSSNPKAAAADASAARAGARTPRAGSRRLPAAGNATVFVAVLPAGKVVVARERRGWRRPAAGARVFASEAVGAAAEPVSPKVSCFGAVRSSERRAAAVVVPEKQEEEGEQEEKRSGCCWASVTAAAARGLCWNSDDPPRVTERPEASGSGSAASTAMESPPPNTVLSPPRRPVAGLGDVKRLASRRWPDTMMAGEAPGLV